MTQIIVTLEEDTNPIKLRTVIANLKGVFSASIREADMENTDVVQEPFPQRLVPNSKTEQEKEEWSRTVRQMAGSIDPDKLDLSDERTSYIMSK